MPFETTVRAFAAALDDPSAATPAMTQGRMGAPDASRFAVYRNNVAAGLIGALEARYPVSRRIAGDELFRAIAREFVRAHKPRTPVMIATATNSPNSLATFSRGWRPGMRLNGTLIARTARGDAAIQSHRLSPSSLDRFAYARDDEDGSSPLSSFEPPPSPTSRGSRTPGSEPIMPKTRPPQRSPSLLRLIPIVCPIRGSPFIPRRGSCASQRQQPRYGPRRKTPTSRRR